MLLFSCHNYNKIEFETLVYVSNKNQMLTCRRTKVQSFVNLCIYTLVKEKQRKLFQMLKTDIIKLLHHYSPSSKYIFFVYYS